MTWKRKKAFFIDFCASNGLSQLVSQPTHNSSNVLDLVLSGDGSIQNVQVLNSPVATDHKLVHFQLDVSPPKTSDRRQCFFDYNKGDYNSIKINLSLIDWERFFDSCSFLDKCYTRFLEYVKFLR